MFHIQQIPSAFAHSSFLLLFLVSTCHLVYGIPPKKYGVGRLFDKKVDSGGKKLIYKYDIALSHQKKWEQKTRDGEVIGSFTYEIPESRVNFWYNLGGGIKSLNPKLIVNRPPDVTKYRTHFDRNYSPLYRNHHRRPTKYGNKNYNFQYFGEPSKSKRFPKIETKPAVTFCGSPLKCSIERKSKVRPYHISYSNYYGKSKKKQQSSKVKSRKVDLIEDGSSGEIEKEMLKIDSEILNNLKRQKSIDFKLSSELSKTEIDLNSGIQESGTMNNSSVEKQDEVKLTNIKELESRDDKMNINLVKDTPERNTEAMEAIEKNSTMLPKLKSFTKNTDGFKFSTKMTDVKEISEVEHDERQNLSVASSKEVNSYKVYPDLYSIFLAKKRRKLFYHRRKIDESNSYSIPYYKIRDSKETYKNDNDANRPIYIASQILGDEGFKKFKTDLHSSKNGGKMLKHVGKLISPILHRVLNNYSEARKKLYELKPLKLQRAVLKQVEISRKPLYSKKEKLKIKGKEKKFMIRGRGRRIFFNKNLKHRNKLQILKKVSDISVLKKIFNNVCQSCDNIENGSKGVKNNDRGHMEVNGRYNANDFVENKDSAYNMQLDGGENIRKNSGPNKDNIGDNDNGQENNADDNVQSQTGNSDNNGSEKTLGNDNIAEDNNLDNNTNDNVVVDDHLNINADGNNNNSQHDNNFETETNNNDSANEDVDEENEDDNENEDDESKNNKNEEINENYENDDEPNKNKNYRDNEYINEDDGNDGKNDENEENEDDRNEANENEYDQEYEENEIQDNDENKSNQNGVKDFKEGEIDKEKNEHNENEDDHDYKEVEIEDDKENDDKNNENEGDQKYQEEYDEENEDNEIKTNENEDEQVYDESEDEDEENEDDENKSNENEDDQEYGEIEDDEENEYENESNAESDNEDDIIDE